MEREEKKIIGDSEIGFNNNLSKGKVNDKGKLNLFIWGEIRIGVNKNLLKGVKGRGNIFDNDNEDNNIPDGRK